MTTVGDNLIRVRQAKRLSQRELAAASGVSHSAIGHYEIGHRAPKHKALVALARILNCKPSAIAPDYEPPAVVPVTTPLTDVPILGMAQAAGYEPALEPLVDFIAGHGDDTHSWAEAKPGDFALRVDGDSMSPNFPHGTLVLVAGGEFPQRGDIVVARLSDNDEVVVKRYDRRNNTVSLQAINPNGRSWEIHIKDERGRLVWLWPVVRAEIDPRRQRRGSTR